MCLAAVAAMLYLSKHLCRGKYGIAAQQAPTMLLNTTSKYRASIAACLTILSYMATACISAYEAMHYLHNLWHGLPVIGATLLLLGFFMVLSLIGITESAVVAVGIFVFHIVTLTLLMGARSSILVSILRSLRPTGPSLRREGRSPRRCCLVSRPVCLGSADLKVRRTSSKSEKGVPQDLAEHVDRGGGLQSADQFARHGGDAIECAVARWDGPRSGFLAFMAEQTAGPGFGTW